jgi:hypothetical protein
VCLSPRSAFRRRPPVKPVFRGFGYKLATRIKLLRATRGSLWLRF